MNSGRVLAERAFEKELKPGKYLRVYFVQHHGVER